MTTSPGFSVQGADWLRHVTDEAIEDQVGTGSLQRARQYARSGMVESINTGDRGRMLLATVSGSRSRPYTSMVTLASDATTPQWVSRCSCPMAVDCKHVAALLLVAREHVGGELDGVSDELAWRKFVGALLEDIDGAGPAGAARLGLRFVVKQGHGFRVDSLPQPQIELMACKMNRTGRWGVKQMWDEARVAGYGYSREDLDRSQASAISALQQVLGSSAEFMTYGRSRMLQESGPAVWDALRAVRDSGVELLPGVNEPGEVRLLDRRLRPQVEFTTAPDGTVRGGVHLGLDTDGDLVMIGDPVHGVAVVDDSGIALIGFDRPASAMTSALLRHGDLTIPAQDADEFLDLYYPRLARLMPDAQADDAATTGRVQLQLTLVSPQEHTVQVTAHMLYAGRHQQPVSLDYLDRTRDRVAERELVERLEPALHEAGLLEMVGGLGWWPASERTVSGWQAVRLLQVVEELRRSDDVRVEIKGELPAFEQSEATPLIEVGTADGDDPDWFDLHVSVTLDGEEVPFEPLFHALVRGEEVMLLDSGTWFSLDHPALVRLRELIREAREIADRESDGLRINRFHLGLWEELVDLGIVGQQSSTWERAVGRLADIDEFSAPPVPAGLQATLRPYQLEGYSWLSALWDCGLGGILADDMGLGKTVQALAALVRAHEAGELDRPVLVVAPSSVVGTWVNEAAKFAPGIPVTALTQTSRKRGTSVSEAADDARIVVTSYAVLRLDADAFRQVDWRGLLLDEAQSVKNHQSKTFQAAKRIGAPFTLAITGTPLENSLMDLWSLLSLSAPGLYPKPDVFGQAYRRPIENGSAPELLDQLRRRIRPLMLRRTKDQVATDLPDKQIQRLDVSMTPRHDQAYRRQLQRERQRVLGLLEDVDGNRVAILASLTRLRQLALDPRLVDDDYSATERSAKLTVLVEQLTELAQEGHRALVFSQFTSYLRLAEQALAQAGVTTAYLDGSTRKRQQVIDGFKSGDQTAFLISLKAGGVGLTLTEADYVFVLDPWWNPAAEAQAIDRAHRIGQDKPVTVYRLVSRDTIEEKVVALQERKRDLFTRVVDEGGALSGAITAADIRALFD
ncbi:DEAD/DEAH box helicase [Leekyejoonella antrihumi]|uniref:DEAD/DEAH box helicase n=1 Tax=Leekyejoonella antrihumi TaxID=1660198 RepID=UPI001FEA3389|nr:DEAD/DEAH box helicase [Leekyejoonella antrihumi]